MCGIVGITSNHPLPVEREQTLAAMMDSIRHRGRDGDGRAILPSAFLGHLRLAIIDPGTGHQPMYSSDGRYVIVYNGEIYNYQEIRQTLVQQGVLFHTHSDTEVLLYLLINEKKNAVHRLNGMFSFFFYDTETKEWIAARDHFGIKPFYYVTNDDEFIFASEIKALLCHPLISSERNDFALQQYLTFQFCLGPETLFKNVKRLEPGHILHGAGSKILSDQCYWDTKYEIDNYHTEEFFLDRLRSSIEDSVRLQLRSDVPLGAYLSGGIDSSLICVLASRFLGDNFPMYHGRFAEGPEYDESEYAREIISHTKGAYHEIIPTPSDFVDVMPRLIYMLDEPVAGPGVFPQFVVSKLASQDVKVILGGQGGDEIFGGYARYLIGYLEQALKGAIFQTQEEGRHLVTLETIIPHLPVLKEYLPLLSQFWNKGVFEDMDARYFHLIDRNPEISNNLSSDIVDAMDKEKLFNEFKKIFNNPDTKSYINKMTHFDQKTALQALLQIEDRVSMSVSMESRVPLLDHRIVDLMTTMPPPLKFQGGQPKHILKKAIQTILPAKVMNRKDKMGFPVPLKKWMQGGPVRDFVTDILLSQRSLQRGIYNKKALENMVSGQSGVGARALWGALSLELWHRCFIDAG